MFCYYRTSCRGLCRLVTQESIQGEQHRVILWCICFKKFKNYLLPQNGLLRMRKPITQQPNLMLILTPGMHSVNICKMSKLSESLEYTYLIVLSPNIII